MGGVSLMECGYYHPERGYWQTITEPDTETLAGYPAGTVNVPTKPGENYEWQEGEWIYVSPDPLDLLMQEREQMVCSALQGKLALGAERWADVEALLNDTETPWAMKQVILTATEWPRTSQLMTELAWLLDYDDDEVDDLFRLAMSIEV